MKKIYLAVLILLCAAFCTAGLLSFGGCSKDPHADSLLLHLTFDEGEGNVVKDKSGNLADATVQYVFNDPAFQAEPQDPQWRETGAVGGSLLLDGYSNYVRYHYEDVRVSGSSLTVSAWVAPRVFEWDDPNAAENGTENLTAIVSQYNEEANQGFLLGYQRHGAWSFQVGIGDRYLRLWDGGHPLVKYEWNHVAATFDGANGVMKMYLNGEEIASRNFYENASIDACSDWLYIGRNNHGDSNATATCNMVSGLIDDTKIYRAVLSGEEIASYYNSCLQDGKVAEISFEDIWLQNILTEDIYKPQYHGGPYQHWMNEPHAPFYYNGKYHLFFQFNLTGPYFRNICWGHLVSDDMVNWTPLKEVITPEAGTVAPDGVWSGGATLDADGNPVLFFTAGNDSWASSGDRLIGNQNVGIARPKDLSDPNLTEWEVYDGYAIRQQAGQGTAGQFRDMFVYREEKGDGYIWYMLICTKSTQTNGGAALLYTTEDDSFTSWTYRGEVFNIPNQPSDLGQTWELPVLIPISNEAGTITKWLFAFSPAPADSADNDIFYFIGEFDKTTYRFKPDASFGNTPRRFDFGNNVFTGPSAFVDPVSGKVFMFSIMQDQRTPNDQYLAGWAHSVGLAREVYLNDEGTDACIRPADALENYEGKVLAEGENMTLSQANEALSAARGDMLHVQITVRNAGANSFGVRLRRNDSGTEYTDYYYDAANKRLGVKTGLAGDQNISGNFYDTYAMGDTLVMEFYLDRSLIEAFFDDTKAVTARVYPTDETSLGILLYAEGGDIEVVSLRVAEMKSIYGGVR